MSLKELPKHVAVIPDGNRRWAENRGQPVWDGHREGVKRFVEITNAVFGYNIPYFTFWAAQPHNLTKREPLEVAALVGLVRTQLELGLEPFEKKNIRLRVIGRGKELINRPDLTQAIDKFETESAVNNKFNLAVYFGYSGIEEIVSAANSASLISPGKIDERLLKDNHWTRGSPPVDLLIRTGEMEPGWAHNSAGFMMMLTANSEIYYPKLFWPDFTKAEFEKALDGYTERRRKMGV